ncbi:hypothetical protein JVT61DRAFT_14434 [Boletus reticuloceps]|uniref:CxC2-like cysteine cluster KDZ transposase-associated domain-containing protein n=1 Tax=Boletus reticuloceps TaxID=495285 RepID=A0A8I2YTB8_9AGAM|nr:hypothetical protein JVT61DRAFT_14434 [Boletus reticuloceps]
MSPPRKSKRARYTTHRPDGASRGTGSMVVFTSTRTRRGKVRYQEVDTSSYYQALETLDEEDTSRRKIPKTPSECQGTTSTDFPPEAGDFWEDSESQTLRRTKTQNDYLSEWIPWRSPYLDIILQSEAPLQLSQDCSGCSEAKGTIQCMSCFGNHAWCSSCAIKAHYSLPFHRLEQWNGHFYDRVSLQDLGYILYLGHGGNPCPSEGLERMPNMSSQHFTVVDSAGIFVHTVKWCQCKGATQEDKHLELLRERLFPAIITNPQTAFTFDVLEEFLIDSLECKTSTFSFYQKLRRMTSNAFPDSVPVGLFIFISKKNISSSSLPCQDHYRELMRVSREWRDLTNCKRAGFGHNSDRSPGHGDLAIFCAACPQPGINLPNDWKNRYPSDTVALQYVVDGNFTAQHMKMKRPQDDVSLSDGLAYMVEDEPYQRHVASAGENMERSTCQNHWAVNEANILRSNLRATGIGATACARHGCFVPHAIVDFYKGEQQKNIDYSVCQALAYHSAGLKRALVVYDVACQWSINFHRQVESYNILSLPSEMDIVPTVGKFHLSAHKPTCFPRFSLMFIPGAGHVDGEILETLWAPFNKISPSARAMSLAHRQEVYDDHMRDLNWKKLVGLVKSLCRKYKTVAAGVQSTEEPFKELSASLDENKVREWTTLVLKGACNRGEALDIYALRMDKAPTLAEIRLHLTQSSVRSTQIQESINWLVEDIDIENSQYVVMSYILDVQGNTSLCRDALRAEIRCLPSSPSTAQKTAIAVKRQRLLARIMKFNQKAAPVAAGLNLGSLEIVADDHFFCKEENSEAIDEDIEILFWQAGKEDDKEEEDPGEDGEDNLSDANPESIKLYMPSSFGAVALQEAGLLPLVEEEIQLRIGQANDSLEKLRNDLGEKSILYRINRRSSTSNRTDTRSKQDIRRVGLKVNRDVRSYLRAVNALTSMDAGKTVLGKYKIITREDLGLSKDITEENRFGQSSHVLPWFWRMEGFADRSSSDWNDEFLRVSWLKAKARYERWEEELVMVKCSGESGKSTIIKQMRIIHQNGFTDEELMTYRPTIYRNTLDSAQAIVLATRKIGLEYIDPNNRVNAEHIFDYHIDLSPSFELSPKIAEAIHQLWQDLIIPKVMDHTSEFYLMELSTSSPMSSA